MGKINKVYYEEVNSEVIDLRTAGEFYYLYNLLGVDDRFHDAFERSEINQMKIRNMILGERKKSGDIGDDNINIVSGILAVSSLKNKVILFADIE